ncbi:serine protease snake-like [Topomyia yanbarensis]|uniref:serine protease snake-like n=1 Tax=Topomyia yanbarensis TaxID=2498891 RepID=UPI00273BF54F|nr:serine protease snake-like [Topomyia yanbarensis]XP_058839222.1 serine protease snake-like [Topomyia yanbarensis]
MMSMSCSVLTLALVFGVVKGFDFPNVERISEKKCSEYRKLTVKTSTLITLSLRPTSIVYEDYKCPNVVDLIVGGEAARRGEFPHQALLGYPGEDDPRSIEFKCGGSLISERYVLTAAHCSSGAKPTVVRLGESDLSDDDDDQVDFDIEDFIRHPEYSPRRAYHDIALVKMVQDVFFTKLIRPACLWEGHDLNITTAYATGYGRTEFAGATSDILRKVQLDILDKSECNSFATSRKFNRGVIDEQICVGSREGGKDTCQGDSGGPLETVTDHKGCMFHILGITSTGAACGYGKSPSIYTRVASYIDWIESVVWSSS